jgi:hypothetical protein
MIDERERKRQWAYLLVVCTKKTCLVKLNKANWGGQNIVLL